MTSKSINRVTLWAFSIVTVLWAIYPFALWAVFHWKSWGIDKRGQFGDTFGALNTLFTGWAFVAVLATLFHQSRQIDEARQDIEDQRKRQEKTEELLCKQVAALNETAQIHALTSRIEAYTDQIEDVRRKKINLPLEGSLMEERHSLIVELNKFLKPHNLRPQS